MSAIPADIGFDGPPPRVARSQLTRSATIYFWLVVGAAAAIALPLVTQIDADTRDWTTFAILGTAAALAQIFVVVTPANQAYHTTSVFLIPAALLLPPELVALMAVVQHVPDWLKRRMPFHIQTFNIANYTLATMGAWGVAHALSGSDRLAERGGAPAVIGLAACLVFVGVNHCLLAPMLRLARGHSLRETGLFSWEGLSTDVVLAALGVSVAVLWHYDPWLTPFVVAPLLLVHRSLSVPALQEEARIDPKTGLYNARHFANMLREEMGRAARFGRPLTLMMADLDLLRDINNSYGHLAGDAVLAGIAKVFRGQLREYDVAARFGGEEFSILLPETTPEEALEIAERIRRAIAQSSFEVTTSDAPIRATVSIGIAACPRDGVDANELVHQADLAVYRAKLQGRNRVVDASNEALLAQPEHRCTSLASLPELESAGGHADPLPSPADEPLQSSARAAARPHLSSGPRFLDVPRRLTALIVLVGAAGAGAGALGIIFGSSTDVSGLIAVIVLVAIGQALSLEIERTGTISVSAVGALTGAAVVGPRAALALALTMSLIEWSTRRSLPHQVLFNLGALTLASLAGAAVFATPLDGSVPRAVYPALGLVAGLAYFAVNTGLLSLALGLEGRASVWRIWRDRFSWLLPHYLVYGFIAAVIVEAYKPIGVWALVVFSLPLFLMRATQEAYVRHTERSASKLRTAAETIQTQNVSLERANRLLKERSTAAMESLSATVDARDAYTAGHSRRVQRLALEIGRELDLSQSELELLGHAALFHDIGKLAVPDQILLKPSQLTDAEWKLMRDHSAEGASIINRLGFLNDAVPAIRHHHERFDGRGYPDALVGEEIPLGARIIHVADAFDSMLTDRVYRPSRPPAAALRELRELAGKQFCPRCVGALEQVVARDPSVLHAAETRQPVAVAS